MVKKRPIITSIGLTIFTEESVNSRERKYKDKKKKKKFLKRRDIEIKK